MLVTVTNRIPRELWAPRALPLGPQLPETWLSVLICPPWSSRLPSSLHLSISNAPGSATKATPSSPTAHPGLSLQPPDPGAPGPLLASQLPLLLTAHSHHAQLLKKHSLPCHNLPFRARGFNPGSMRLWIEHRGSVNSDGKQS